MVRQLAEILIAQSQRQRQRWRDLPVVLEEVTLPELVRVQHGNAEGSARGGSGSAEVIEEVRASPIPPSAELLDAVQILETETYFDKRPWEEVLATGLAGLRWTHPDPQTDPLNVESDQVEPVPPLNRKRRAGQPRIFLGPVAASSPWSSRSVGSERLRCWPPSSSTAPPLPA